MKEMTSEAKNKIEKRLNEIVKETIEIRIELMNEEEKDED